MVIHCRVKETRGEEGKPNKPLIEICFNPNLSNILEEHELLLRAQWAEEQQTEAFDPEAPENVQYGKFIQKLREMPSGYELQSRLAWAFKRAMTVKGEWLPGVASRTGLQRTLEKQIGALRRR